MVDECYEMVRGSVVRATRLDRRGGWINIPLQYAASKAVAKVEINEVSESGSNEFMRSEGDDEPRLHLVKPETTIRFSLDVNFLRVDPGFLHIVTSAPLVPARGGFSSSGFGMS